MMEFTFDTFATHLQTTIPRLEEAERRGLDAAGKMLEANAKAMIGQENENWPPLAEATIEEKQRLGYTGQVSETDPLLRRGDFRDSITHDVVPHEVVLGSTDPRAPFFEWGTDRMPPRPVIMPTLFQHGHEAVDLVANHVMGAVAGRPEPLHHVKPRDGEAA